MQHLNNDMDELFRRAAENYPLNTAGGDWDAVMKKLALEKSIAKEPVKNNNYKHLLWVLLLLPLLFFYTYFSSNKNNKVPANILNKNISNKNLANTISPKNLNQQLTNTNPNTLLTSASLHSRILKNNKKDNEPLKHGENRNVALINNKIYPGIEDTALANSSKENEVIKQKVNKNDLSGNKNQKETADKKSEDHIIPTKNSEREKNTKSKKKSSKKIERGLYAGLIFSPDISTVKFQTVKNIGYSIGLLAGYQFNNKISVEAGIAWDKKHYYSEGEYFNLKNIRLPAYTTINYADGMCRMIEIPLNVKYNLKSGTKSNLSVSAGLSSYIMKREKYVYGVDNNGQQYQYSSTYNNSSTTLLAVANVGIGYNRAINSNFLFRLEPYLKIPVKGVGVGSLPIMSMGLNIGIIKKISR